MFKVKQKIVCVIKANPWRTEKLPVVGEIYTVREVEDNAVRLEEIVNEPRQYVDRSISEALFLNILFRPVDDTFGAETAEKLEKNLTPEEKEIFI